MLGIYIAIEYDNNEYVFSSFDLTYNYPRPCVYSDRAHIDHPCLSLGLSLDISKIKVIKYLLECLELWIEAKPWDVIRNHAI